MKTIKEINDLIKDKTSKLNTIIESAVESEKDFDMAQNELNQEIKDLQKEIPFENTQAGQMVAVLEKTKDEILKIIDEVERTAGIRLNEDFFSSFFNHGRKKILYSSSYDTDFGRSYLSSNIIFNKEKES